MKRKKSLRCFMIILLSAALILSTLPAAFAEENDGAEGDASADEIVDEAIDPADVSELTDMEEIVNEDDDSSVDTVDETDNSVDADKEVETKDIASTEDSIMPLSSSTPITDQVEIQGITYRFTMDPETGTATLKDITNPATDTAVEVPGTFTYEDVTYTVTDVSLYSNYRRYSNIIGLSLPHTLEKTSGLYFGAFSRLKEVTIPGSIKNFTGDFQNSENLEKVIFEEGIEEINTESLAMLGCTVLTEVKLPSTLKTISGLFSGAPALSEINLPEGLTSIGKNAFSKMTSLTHITLPAGITEIPEKAFEKCTALTSVEALGAITSVGSGAFNECTALQSISIGEGSAITSIGAKAFNECKSLNTAPDLSKVTEMGESAFYNCTSLECDIDLSSLNEIPDKAFSYAPITAVTFSDRLTSIGEWALLYSHITSIDFPETLESIGNYAFWYSWIGYPGGTLVIPDSVTSVGTSAFQYIWAKEILVGSGLTELNANVFSDGFALEKITFNNSQDDISGSLPDVSITYLVPSIGDVGDTISDEDGALTLQEAVNQSNPGDTITISKDVKLDSTLNIPAGKKVIITVTEKSGHTIIGNKDNEISKLITVEKEGSVTFDGNLIISGRYNSDSTIDNQGNATLSGSVSIQGGNIGDTYTGIINTHGSNAAFMMTGGTVENNKISYQYSGVIRISDGASIAVSGGTIQNNKVTDTNSYNASSGILLYESSSGKMTGGVITGNSAIRGSAIMLYSQNNSSKAVFTLSGGKITENICTDGTVDGSGAVHIEGNADFTMTGGIITCNVGKNGAGVAVLDPAISRNEQEYGTSFTMDGGEICNNSGSVGGGIYSLSNGVHLNAGTISGNTAAMGGGVYSEGNQNYYSTLHMQNVVITENISNNQGGGMWYCATGDAKIYVHSGGAVYGNTADGAGDDFVSGTKNSAAGRSESSVTLADRMLGGGRVLWYQDGVIRIGAMGTTNAYPSTTAESASKRYGMVAADPAPKTVQNDQSNLALKAVVEEEAAEYAQSQATLFITGNTAIRFGGGVAANGGIVVGEPDDSLINLPVEKVWKDNNNANKTRPESVIVKLNRVTADKSVVLETLVLNEDNEWKGEFKGLPADGSYTVTEENVSGYTTVIEGDTEKGFTITNTYVAPPPGPGSLTTRVTVNKVWKLDDGGTAADSVTVALLQNGQQKETVTLSAANGWTHTWKNLSLLDNWMVVELNVPEGFSSSITNIGNSFTITNDDNQPEEPSKPEDPTTPDKPDKPDNPADPDDPHNMVPDDPMIPGNTKHPADQTGEPATGDSAVPAFWIALFATSAAGAGTLLLYRKRKHQ